MIAIERMRYRSGNNAAETGQCLPCLHTYGRSACPTKVLVAQQEVMCLNNMYLPFSDATVVTTRRIRPEYVL